MSSRQLKLFPCVLSALPAQIEVPPRSRLFFHSLARNGPTSRSILPLHDGLARIPQLITLIPRRGLIRSGEKPKPKVLMFSWKSVAATLVVAGAFWAGMTYVKKEKEKEIFRQRQRQIGKAKIGGEWELVDFNGVPRRSSDFHGSWVLLYFGFTHCPDICPDEIEKMIKALTILEKNVPTEKFVPLFMTVDPGRDTPEAIKRYCSDFSPRLLGLTGTPEQVTTAAKAFRVYFSAAPADDDNDYIVDHTIIIYLIGPDGKFVDYYGQSKTAEQMAEHIESHINRYHYLHL
ncbi:protein SCO1 homolog, mitochondrial-like isoform X2 [Paramacrobiotus metropolitanus]|uniref:protein SCO1 homolog, mitochondrial-like isoform X2 n=1 Tax=Paramacrobiotus metropolitanus TaxID=2943436 RepID=UPI002445E1B4|nr:protein SCO1 homolog, mitochondrial-like isoform X2 [Paramacrobiotus metropolitanus]